MNKTAIKNFAIWARNKLIADITYKTGLLGISEKGIKSPLPQSTNGVQFFDIGTKEPYSISGIEIRQREALAIVIRDKEKQSDYVTAYKSVVEEVAYTWFNRLIAVRFMEVNDYLPSQIRVLSSESAGKDEPDLVTNTFDTDLEFTPYEKDRIMQLKQDNKLDELFRMLFIKQCNTLNAILPNLFEKTNDYTELLLNVAFTDKDGVVYRLVHDISEDDFNVSKEGQVEIIGWLYQYYNTEPKQAVFNGLKKNIKITKENIPAATQLFTPDWIVRYMVENSLGRLWLESHTKSSLRKGWKYYIEEAEQTPEVAERLRVLRTVNAVKLPEGIKVIDPCMGSGHILVYAFDVLMQIYTSEGYSERDAAKLILEKNLYGLEIDRRAYQLAYFSLMMKARHYNRRILTLGVRPQVYEPTGYMDGMEYGSLVRVDKLEAMPEPPKDQITLFDVSYDTKLNTWNFRKLLAQNYDVVVTNPPYMGSKGMSAKLSEYVQKNYPDSKSDLFAVFIEKCGELLNSTGYQAMITQHAWMFLSSYEKLRGKLINRDIVNMSHLGARAFEEIGGEVVQTTAFVLSKLNITNFKATYVRLLDYNSQQAKEEAFLSGTERHIASVENFKKIPGYPVAYWVSESIMLTFCTELIADLCEIKQGLATCNNNLFLRNWTEVEIDNIGFDFSCNEETFNSDIKWFPYNKGGGFRKWYGNNFDVLNWKHGGRDIHAYNNIPIDYQSAPVRAKSFYFKSGITYGLITSTAFSARNISGGFVFDVGGSMLFPEQNIKLYILGLLSTKLTNTYLNIINPTLNYQVGDIGKIPVIICKKSISKVKILSLDCVDISKIDWDAFETSWDFKRHPLICGSRTIAMAFATWEREAAERFDTIKSNEEELNHIFIDIYGLQGEIMPKVEDKDVTVRRADLGREVRSLISYAVGCLLGRYSLDIEGLAFAGGEWDAGKYKTFSASKDNILLLCDEEYFDDDITGRFVNFVKTVYGADTLEENLDFIAKALGNRGNTSREIIRSYFLKDFFNDHCKIYQKRPIYWLFDSGKTDGFKALIYMHRYDENTIGNIRVDYLHKMQRIYEREITRMQETIDSSTNSREVAAAEKRKDKLTKQLKETKDYDEKIAHLALARIAIDLDDGVKVNYGKMQTGTDGKKLEVLAKI